MQMFESIILTTFVIGLISALSLPLGAVWLFGSGPIGLVGIARKRKAT